MANIKLGGKIFPDSKEDDLNAIISPAKKSSGCFYKRLDF